jgi:hypothetical protein
MTLTSLSTSDWHARAASLRYETRHFIDGKFVDSVAKGRFTVINPATGAPLCEVSAGTIWPSLRPRGHLRRGCGAARRLAIVWRCWQPMLV